MKYLSNAAHAVAPVLVRALERATAIDPAGHATRRDSFGEGLQAPVTELAFDMPVPPPSTTLPPLQLQAVAIAHSASTRIDLRTTIKAQHREGPMKYVSFDGSGAPCISEVPAPGAASRRTNAMWAFVREMEAAQPRFSSLEEWLAFRTTASLYCAVVAMDVNDGAAGDMTTGDALSVLNKLNKLRGESLDRVHHETTLLFKKRGLLAESGQMRDRHAELVRMDLDGKVGLNLAAALRVTDTARDVAEPVDLGQWLIRILSEPDVPGDETAAMLRAIRTDVKLSGQVFAQADVLMNKNICNVGELLAAGMILSLPPSVLEQMVLPRSEVQWYAAQALAWMGLSRQVGTEEAEEIARESRGNQHAVLQSSARHGAADARSSQSTSTSRWFAGSLDILQRNAERLETLRALENKFHLNFEGEELSDLLDFYVPDWPRLSPAQLDALMITSRDEAAPPMAATADDVPPPLIDAADASTQTPPVTIHASTATEARTPPTAFEAYTAADWKAMQRRFDRFKADKRAAMRAAEEAERKAASAQDSPSPSSKTSGPSGRNGQKGSRARVMPGYNHGLPGKQLKNSERKARWGELVDSRRAGRKYTRELREQIDGYANVPKVVD